MNRFYTGVGSRTAPPPTLAVLKKVATKLADHGWVVRSGGADGCDTAFEQGALGSTHKAMEVWLPAKTFHGRFADGVHYFNAAANPHWEKAKTLARSIHPVFDRLPPFVQALHTRNIFQVLGHDLATPSRCLICWAPTTQSKDGITTVKGGTRTAVECAKRYNIPVINTYNPEDFNRLLSFAAHP